MDWHNLRKNRGHIVQDYAREFRNRELTLDIPLYMQETLLNYNGSLHSYLRHIILMFNPTNIDEFYVQATHIDSRGNNVKDKFSNK